MNNSQDKGLEFTGSLPFSVDALQALPEPGALLVINQSNDQVLRSVMMLEEKLDQDDDDPVMMELRRQDQKINLVLELLSNLMVQFKAIPPSKEVLLTHIGLSYAEDGPSVSGLCEVQLYIEPGMPRPLQLYGIAGYDQINGRTVITFQGMSQSLIDNLDKYIFRFHRRLVASSRKND